VTPTLSMVLIYARDVRKTADFYMRFFGFQLFANAKDPDKNNISISSRPFRRSVAR